MEIAAVPRSTLLAKTGSQSRPEVRRQGRPCAACPLRLELFERRQQDGYWKERHQRSKQLQEKLQKENAALRARIQELERELFGRRSERRSCSAKTQAGKKSRGKGSRRRGQQCGHPGPKRRDTSNLPVREEFYKLAPEASRCPCCGLAYASDSSLGTEDSEVTEIDVRAHKRRIRRVRYRPTCQCPIPKILTAPGPEKLIPKGRYGISLWVTILLDKYAFLRPTHRLLADLRSHGLDLSVGTVTGGLKRLTPLFEPIRQELIRYNLTQRQWHADETGWPVFLLCTEKVGSNWKLWVFQSHSAVVFVLDPTRQARVPESYFGDLESGVLIVDRYVAYKAMKQVKQGHLKLAFCWVHVRRDYLKVAQNWEGHEAWGLSWVDAIGQLFYLNRKRLEATPEEFSKWDAKLRQAVKQMAKRRDEELSQETLHPVRRKPLESLVRHWEGLTLFLDHPEIDMDNNRAERRLRNCVCARKQFLGSRALWAGQLAATLFSLFATLELWAINPRLWLTAYFQACAEAGGQAPEEAQRWLPWNLPINDREALAEGSPIDDTS